MSEDTEGQNPNQKTISRRAVLQGAFGLVGRALLRGAPNPTPPEHISHPLFKKAEQQTIKPLHQEHPTPKSSEVKAVIAFPELNTSEFHLPKPDMTAGKDTATGLYERIIRNDRVREHVDTLLLAQQDVYKALPKLGVSEKDVPMFMPIVWMWSEGGEYLYPSHEGYPNTYQTNYVEPKYWPVHRWKPVYKSGDLQIGSAQAYDAVQRKPSIRDIYTAIHGDNPNTFRDNLNKIVQKSGNQDVDDWNYNAVPYENLAKKFLTPDQERRIKEDVMIRLDDVSVDLKTFNSEDGKSNFFTMLVMKDPSVSYALNIQAIRNWLIPRLEDVSKGKRVKELSPEKTQRMSNMLYAIYRRYQDLRNEGKLDATLDVFIPQK